MSFQVLPQGGRALEFTQIRDTNSIDIASLVEQRTNLVKVSITPDIDTGEVGLSCVGLEPIAAALGQHLSIKRVNLEGNDCLGGDPEARSAEALADMLRKTKTIKYLNVSDCGLIDRDVDILISAIAANRSLEKVAIHTNMISRRCLEDFRSLAASKQIQIERLILSTSNPSIQSHTEAR